MDQPESHPPARSTLLVDAVLTLAVFALFTWILKGHVPSFDPVNAWLWGAVSSSCLTALFWLALQMFRAVLRAQQNPPKE